MDTRALTNPIIIDTRWNLGHSKSLAYSDAPKVYSRYLTMLIDKDAPQPQLKVSSLSSQASVSISSIGRNVLQSDVVPCKPCFHWWTHLQARNGTWLSSQTGRSLGKPRTLSYTSLALANSFIPGLDRDQIGCAHCGVIVLSRNYLRY